MPIASKQRGGLRHAPCSGHATKAQQAIRCSNLPLVPRRVMIVDDHERIRTSLTRLVRGWGHEVAVAVDGVTALSLADAFDPECAIVDLSMPGVNGIELARRLRQRFPPTQLCLIALTGDAGEHMRPRRAAPGVYTPAYVSHGRSICQRFVMSVGKPGREIACYVRESRADHGFVALELRVLHNDDGGQWRHFAPLVGN
jgi:CheY-like chemotaxis protein